LVAVKITISLVCWLLSGFALFYSYVALSSAIFPPSWAPEGYQVLRILWAVAMWYAWLALLVMNIAWVKDVRLGKFWPASGTIVGGAFIVKFATLTPTVLLYAASTFMLSTYLVYFHLVSKKRVKNEHNNGN